MANLLIGFSCIGDVRLVHIICMIIDAPVVTSMMNNRSIPQWRVRFKNIHIDISNFFIHMYKDERSCKFTY